MKVAGACHCGSIRFEADVAPETTSICHCTDCQTLSGSAFRTNVRTTKGGFRLLAGQPKVYVKTAESGTRRAHGFCGECGTPIYSCAITDPQIYGLRLGTLRERAQLEPMSMGWCRSMQTWVTELGRLARFEKQTDVKI